jgi:hypothetical protein
MESFAPSVVSKDDLRERLRGSMNEPPNFITYQRFISTLTDAIFEHGGEYGSMSLEKWYLSPERDSVLKGFDDAYLRLLDYRSDIPLRGVSTRHHPRS